ncbi:ABC transporter substrate-binding protein [Microbacterium horticulturae]|uniref:ABC transporter substrate-binding protein n=1 Tax=Microbacterium horticulturae TaxID=3028316 RepID=A0ABY8C1F6_9MICO|nr:ABC transporter substrate-binding protein [Microbacterium sp. KACC 23027]WEG08478.1 ABC transporter substrate-binding protein [Microbacterium sp. KACC 23027]
MNGSRRRVSTLLALAVASTIALAGCSGSASPDAGASGDSAAMKVSVGVTPIPNAAPLYLAEKLGYFTDENLDVTPQIVASAGAAVPLLQSGDLQFAEVSSTPTITATSKGLPLRVVSGDDRYNDDASATDGAALVAAKGSGLTKISELNGKTVAVVGLKSGPELVMRVAIDQAGGDDSKVKFVEIAYPDMVSALESGRVDAALITDPFLSQAKEKGLTVISQPYIDAMPGKAGILWIGSGNWIDQNPEAAAAFQRAITKAVDYAAENPDAVRDIMSTYTKSSKEAIKATVLPVFDSSITADDMKYWADTMLQYGFIDTAYDPSDLIWKP